MMRRGLFLLFFVVTSVRAEPLFFLEAELDSNVSLIHAQVILSLRFYQGADLRDLVLEAPQIRLADVRSLGETQVSEEVRGGMRYRRHQRRFAVFPFASGKLELAAVAQGRPVGATALRRWTVPLTLEVRPVPAQGGDAARWLPAHAVRLEEKLPKIAPASPVEVGAVVGRTLRIEADGLTGEQLPELSLVIPGATVLPRPARVETQLEKGRLRGVREQYFEIVPQRPGRLLLPAVTLPWWKVGAGGADQAALPARTLDVAGLPDSPAPVTLPRSGEKGLAILSGLAAVGLIFLLGRRGRDPWRIWRACRRGEDASVRSGLLEWAARCWRRDPPLTLIALAARLNAPAALAVCRLDRRLHGPVRGETGAGDAGILLWQVLWARTVRGSG